METAMGETYNRYRAFREQLERLRQREQVERRA